MLRNRRRPSGVIVNVNWDQPRWKGSDGPVPGRWTALLLQYDAISDGGLGEKRWDGTVAVQM